MADEHRSDEVGGLEGRPDGEAGSQPLTPGRDAAGGGTGASEGATGPASPLGTAPQDSEPLPGDPREAQEPQEPRTTHVAPGRDPAGEVHEGADRTESGSDHGVVDQLREAWDRIRGK